MFTAKHPVLRQAVSEMARERTEMNVMRPEARSALQRRLLTLSASV